jgi:multicomponent Na+:H+ antiporter subunit B
MIRQFDSLMLRTLVGPLVAAMQLFAVYVLMHGHYSPGGGFQAGILIAASLILPMLVRGGEARAARISLPATVSLTSLGVFIFALIGLIPMLWGQPLLAYGALPIADDLATRHSLGILLVEVGVTLGVAGGMLAIFRALTEPVGAEA